MLYRNTIVRVLLHFMFYILIAQNDNFVVNIKQIIIFT